jgi:hypothetical protein
MPPTTRNPAHYLNDPSLQWPVTEEHVPAGPNSALDNYTFWEQRMFPHPVLEALDDDAHQGPAAHEDQKAMMDVVQWPVTEEHVPAGPNSALDNYTFWLPVVVILVVGGS